MEQRKLPSWNTEFFPKCARVVPSPTFSVFSVAFVVGIYQSRSNENRSNYELFV